MSFGLEMGLSTEPPEIINVPLRGAQAAITGLGRLTHSVNSAICGSTTGPSSGATSTRPERAG
jgi:hypothetical protein